MQISEEKISDVAMRFSVTVPAEVVAEKIDMQLAGHAGNVKVPGFRKGHAPKELVRTNFLGRATKDAIEELIRSVTTDIMNSRYQGSVAKPRYEIKKYEPGQELVFSVVIEAAPLVELKDLKELHIEKIVCEVSQEDFDRGTKAFFDGYTKNVPVDRAVQELDFVDVECMLLHKGQAVHKVSMKDLPVMQGKFEDDSIEQAVYEHIIGLKAGDEITIPFTVPKRFPTKRKLEGKRVMVRLTVSDVYCEQHVPFDAAEAKSLFDVESLDEAQEILMSIMRKIRANSVLFYNRISVMNALAEAYDFDVPGTLVQDDIRRLYPDFLEMLQRESNEPIQKTSAEIIDELLPIATRRTRLGFVFHAMSAKYKLEPSKDDIIEYLFNEAIAQQVEYDDIRERYVHDEEFAKNVRYSVIDILIIKKILEEATITEKVVTAEELNTLIEHAFDDLNVRAGD
ncbi:MAG: trigger factor [Holosporales bacterium]|jgi:trigger factor|nr:trigger factor [Holosporales bacterium]